MSDDPDPSPSAPDRESAGAEGLEIQIAVEDPAWQDAVPALLSRVERAARAALDHRRARPAAAGAAELSILLADDGCVRALNRAYRGRDRATNVLSFPYEEVCLGDVVLARETIEREAAEQGKSTGDHLAHLLVHGILHLCGFDHEDEAEAREMERLEREILAALGLADPYRPSPAEGRVA